MNRRMSFAAALAVGLAFAPAWAESEPRGPFHLKHETPDPGSAVVRTGAWSQDIPFDRAYADLTPGQRDAVRGWYEAMGPRDEPPFPVGGMKPLELRILRAHNRLRAVGELFLTARVEADGRVSEVRVIKTPDPDMSKAVTAALMETPFKPALCDGKPCAMEFPLKQNFRVRL